MSIYCQQERGTRSKLYEAPQEDEEAWDTDPNFVNKQNENSRKIFEADSIDLKKLRQEVHQENDSWREKYAHSSQKKDPLPLPAKKSQ